MMRPIIYQVPPPAPSNLTATLVNGQVQISFTDNSANETGFTIQRSQNDPTFGTFTTITAPPSPALNAAKEGTDWGSTITITDNPGGGTFYYRAQAVDNGWAGSLSQTYNAGILGSLVSGWSNTTAIGTGPNASASPAVLADFGSVLLLSTSAAQTVTVSNTGGAPLGVTSVSFTGLNPADFLVKTNNCSSVPANSSCTITVAFRPTALGPRSAALTIATNDPSHPTLGVTVTGTGIGPVAVLSPITVSFGSQLKGTKTASMSVTLTNTGSAGSTLIINTKSITGANPSDFAQTNNCGASLAATQSCTFTVTFTPTAVGARGATLSVGTTDPVNPTVTSQLTGTGTAPVASVSPTSLNFGNQKQQTTSAPQPVTLSNTGTAPLTMSSIAIGGTNASDFKQTNNCGASLAAGANCTISVTFKPTKKGARSATLTITDNSNANAGSQQNVTVGGTGQ